jgi:hypothetical protein
MKHAFVSFTGCTRFIGVDPGYKQKFVGDFFLDAGKPSDIITDGFLVVSRTWTDDDHEAV